MRHRVLEQMIVGHEIVAAACVDEVGAIAGENDVVAGSRDDAIVAVSSVDFVGCTGADDVKTLDIEEVHRVERGRSVRGQAREAAFAKAVIVEAVVIESAHDALADIGLDTDE